MYVVAVLQQGGNLVGGQTTALSGVVSAPAPAATTPTVTAQGVVHAASDQGGVPIAPGGLITVYGVNLSDGVGQNTGLPLPQQLNGTQVLLGNQPLPILYTSTGQLNVQVPYTVPVNTQYQLTVQHGNTLSLPQSLVVAAGAARDLHGEPARDGARRHHEERWGDVGAAWDAGQHRRDGGDLLHGVGGSVASREGRVARAGHAAVIDDGEPGDGDDRREGCPGGIQRADAWVCGVVPGERGSAVGDRDRGRGAGGGERGWADQSAGNDWR